MTANGGRTYTEAIRSSLDRYPDLYKFSDFLTGPLSCTGRAAVLEFGTSRVERYDFQNANSLRRYFSRVTGSPCQNRLYLLEDLSQPFVEAFGAHFWMDPFLFAAQENSTHWTATRHPFALPQRLPSWKKTDQSYTMRFYEVVKSEGPDVGRRDLFTVSNVGRKIEPGHSARPFGETQDPATRTYLVRRNASFWWRENDGGWDALILVDPPIGDLIAGARGKSPRRKWWNHYPYGFGYVDFSPWDSGTAGLTGQGTMHGPPRSSILDDIAWYWTSVADAEQVASVARDATASAIFLKKIIASNWNVVLEFIWAKLSEIERELSHLDKDGLRHLSDILSEVHLFRRRLSWYLAEVETSLENVGLPTESRSRDDGKELLSVLARLRTCKEKIESLTPIVTGMLSVQQADMSMNEARLVSKLTYIALTFLPLSLIAGILSMGGDFQPGHNRFWVYFTVAIPVTLILLALAWWLR